MKTALAILVVTALLLFLVGCANPVNAVTAQRYYDAGLQAERNGDLRLAHKSYWNAFGNAQLGNLGEKAKAYPLYEFARVSGYMGNFTESEKAFADVIDLIAKSAGEADQLLAPALAEYARLLHDTDQHNRAIPIYERLVPELESVDILKIDPLGFTLVLDDYATSLEKAGKKEKSEEVSRRSSELKAEYQIESPKHEARRYKT